MSNGTFCSDGFEMSISNGTCGSGGFQVSMSNKENARTGLVSNSMRDWG